MWDSASTMIFVSIKCWEIGWFSCLCRKILWVPRVFSSCWLVVEFRYSEKGCITSRIMKTRWKWLKFDYQFTQRIKISAAGREGLTSGHTRREPHNDLNYDRCLRGKFVCGLGSLGPLAVIIQFSTSLAESLELTRKEKSCMFAAASPLMPKSCLTGSVIDWDVSQGGMEWTESCLGLHWSFDVDSTGCPICSWIFWVDLEFAHSAVSPSLLRLMGILQKQLDKLVEHPNQSQPNPGPRADGTPCILAVYSATIHYKQDA